MTKTEFLQVLNSFAGKFAAKIDSLFVRKVDGKGLSTNDFTTELKNKLDGIEAGAKATVVDSALNAESLNPVQNKIIKAALDGKSDSDHTHTFAELTEKPTTLAGYGITDAEAKGAAAQALADAKSYTDDEISALVNGAPETMDTLKELADAISSNKSVADAITEAIGTKANASDLSAHTGDAVAHITAEERTNWNAAFTAKHEHANSAVLAATTASFTTEEKEKLAQLDVMEDISEADIDKIIAGSFVPASTEA